MPKSVELRPATAADRELLLRIYASTRDDVSAAPLSATERATFLEMQFEAQRADYGKRFSHAEHSIVVVNGEDAGRIWMDRRSDEIRLLDIALLPGHRNRGIGRELLERLIGEANHAGLALRHSVYKTNTAALRFYERLGFEVIEDYEMYVLMQWRGSGFATPGD